MKTTNKIIMNYEPLPVEITQNGGHRYKQLGRNVDTAVYEQHGHHGQLLGYEVIRIKKQKATEMFGRKYPAKEVYPCSEDWGTLAFTVNTLERADEVARSLSKSPRKAISSPCIAQRSAISSIHGSGQREKEVQAKFRKLTKTKQPK
jgi:hypothetical protein